MIDIVATEPLWMVLTERVELLPVDVGQQFTTSQVCEQFTSEELARERMIELDPDWVDSELTVDEVVDGVLVVTVDDI